MAEVLENSAVFPVALTVLAYLVGVVCQKKVKTAICNPILIGAALVMLALYLLDIPVERYQQGCRTLTFFLTPATICLAISCYSQLRNLKKHLLSICLGVLGGTLTSLVSVSLLCGILGLDAAMTASLLPKSVTSAIGVALSEQLGGIGAVSTVVIVLTGILGNIASPLLCKIFRLEDPVSRGVALGTAAHVVGTSRATELSELTGAVSSLALTLAGLITTAILSFVTI